jgi:cytoskeletal protein CcmA (bactofilin family)
MSLKDNFNQAIKEILRKDGAVAPKTPAPDLDKIVREQTAEQPRANTASQNEDFSDSAGAEDSLTPSGASRVQDADAVLRAVKGAEGTTLYPRGGAVDSLLGQNPRQAFEEPAPDYMSAGRNPGEPRPAGYNTSGFTGQAQNTNSTGYAQNAGFSQGAAPNQGYNPNGYSPAGRYPIPGYDSPEPERFEIEETTIISRNTVIDGNIRAFANVAVEGSVKGDIRVTKDVSMSGRVVGDIECNNSSFTGASMQGSVTSKGQVQLDRDSLLLGDITAQYLNINGKIKGNVDVGGKAEFKSEAYILGNISAATITVIDGANIQGYVNTTAFRDSTANVFPEAISVESE